MAKKFAFKQCFRNGTEVYLDKMFVGAVGLLVNSLSNQLFSRAIFPQNQYIGFGFGHAVDGFKNLTHGGTIAQNLWDGIIVGNRQAFLFGL